MAKKKQLKTEEVTTTEEVKDTSSKQFTMAVTFEDGIDQIKKSIATFFGTIFITNPEYNEQNSKELLRNDDILNYVNSLKDEELCQIYNDIMNTCFSFIVGNGLFYKFDTEFVHIKRNNDIGELLKNLRTSLNDILDTKLKSDS
jgi:hypothetical protein